MLEWVSGPLLYAVLGDSLPLSAGPANMPQRRQMEPVIEATMGLRTPTVSSNVTPFSVLIRTLFVSLIA